MIEENNARAVLPRGPTLRRGAPRPYRCHEAPFYMLGPLTTDIAPG
jgi:hypothetical protein